MVVPAFGFSVGDFIAAIKIGKQAVRALSKTSGAAYDFQLTLAELEATENILRRLQSFEPTSSNEDTARQIQYLSHLCGIPVAAFLKRIDSLRKRLEHNGTPDDSLLAKVAKDGSKVHWAVAVQADFAELKAQISQPVRLIGILLQDETIEQNKLLQQPIEEIFERTRTLDARIMSFENHFRGECATRSQMDELSNLITELKRKTAEQDIAPEVTSLKTLVKDASIAQADSNAQMHEKLKELICMVNILCVAGADLNESHGRIRPRTGSIQPHKPINRKVLPPKAYGAKEIKLHDPREREEASVQRIMANFSEDDVSMLERITRHFFCLWLVNVFHIMTIRIRSLMVLRQTPIQFIDALGREDFLPYEYFCHMDILQVHLERTFKEKSFISMIRRQQFCFVNLRKGSAQDFEVERWEDAVVPGFKVAMSMFVQETGGMQACPRCRSQTFLSSNKNDTKECAHCGQICHFRTALISDQYGSTYVSSLESKNPAQDIDESQKQPPLERDLPHFKRVHVWSRVVRRPADLIKRDDWNAQAEQKLLQLEKELRDAVQASAELEQKLLRFDTIRRYLQTVHSQLDSHLDS